ncbi:MAG: hypothetical protein FLDDKLPJ_00340 [Phycisphaerae bacterium]|nr:hypothetical protein [Phycisphaerae bacterium]
MSSTLPDAITANSLAEVHLYLLATPCPDCGRGPLQGGDGRRVSEPAGPLELTIPIVCAACARTRELRAVLPRGTGIEGEVVALNPTDEPSGILDVAQWVTLFRMITAKAAAVADRAEARRLGLEAAQCLEEALKFYRQDSDLPPPEAFFSEASRRRMSEHPAEFSRQRLVDLRARLPSTRRMRDQLAERPAAPKRRRWFGR